MSTEGFTLTDDEITARAQALFNDLWRVVVGHVDSLAPMDAGAVGTVAIPPLMAFVTASTLAMSVGGVLPTKESLVESLQRLPWEDAVDTAYDEIALRYDVIRHRIT